MSGRLLLWREVTPLRLFVHLFSCSLPMSRWPPSAHTPFTLTPFTITPGGFQFPPGALPPGMPVPYGVPVQPQAFAQQSHPFQWPPQQTPLQTFPAQPSPQPQWLQSASPQQFSATQAYDHIGMATAYFPPPPPQPFFQPQDAATAYWSPAPQLNGPAAVNYFSDTVSQWPPAAPQKAPAPQSKAPQKAGPAKSAAASTAPLRQESQNPSQVRPKPPKPPAARRAQSVPPKKSRLGLTKEDKHELITGATMVLAGVALATLLMI
eukprot:GGOE01009960.1.p2 GENE.GGOE01009960.1~~GGOE01009960.1.p2  ORF type:complete len:264 (+),score=33.58 GGOE01009960.1:247-1038(+)